MSFSSSSTSTGSLDASPGRTRVALAVATTLGLAAALLLHVGAPAQAATGKQATQFAFHTSGYGTRVKGGEVPAKSDTTAYEAIGCTNLGGISRENHVAKAKVPGVGTAYGLTTTMRTAKKDGVVSDRTRSHVNRLVIGDQATTGVLEIRALDTVVTASHGPKGYDTDYTSSVGGLAFTDPTGTTQDLALPTPGTPVEIPGLLTISVGEDRSTTSPGTAHAEGFSLSIRLTPSGTKVLVGHALAVVSGDVKHGLFGGRAAAIRGDALGGTVDVDEQPLRIMPCQGTRGHLRERDIAGLTPGGALVVSGLHSSVKGDQTSKEAYGRAVGEVASVDIGGQVQVTGIKGVANVRRTDTSFSADKKGSTIGSVTVNGEEQSFPPSGVIEVPGLLRLERNLVTRSTNGIAVIALRITLLDGTGATVDLGMAKLKLKKAKG